MPSRHFFGSFFRHLCQLIIKLDPLLDLHIIQFLKLIYLQDFVLWRDGKIAPRMMMKKEKLKN